MSGLRRIKNAAYWLTTFRARQRWRERKDHHLILSSGIFDAAFYASQLEHPIPPNVDPIIDFVRRSKREPLNPHPLFDTRYYCGQVPGLAESDLNPLVHFLLHGADEGRDPHPYFDVNYYRRQIPYLSGSGINPLQHFLDVGAVTGRDPHPDIDLRSHVRAHPELRGAGQMNPLVHLLQSGGAEGVTAGRGAAAARSSRPPDPKDARASAVILHLYYPELWYEFRRFLAPHRDEIDLFVSVPQDAPPQLGDEIRESFPEAVVVAVENRGRDIAPFIEFMRDSRMWRYQQICKIHSKKSPHRVDGDRWRQELLRSLLGSSRALADVRDRFARDAKLGILGPAAFIDRREESWGSNRSRVAELAGAMGLAPDEVRLEFFAGSMFWFRPQAMAPLLDLNLSGAAFEEEKGQLDGALCHALERLFPLSARAAGYELGAFAESLPDAGSPLSGEPRPPANRLRLVAFYLPQFHPIPENDRWWGPGFTEWTNVARARPLFPEHVQPRLPGELGFYDLRLPEAREAQAELAREFGIDAFCYYHYWFNGRRLLDRPLREILERGRPVFPFCVCWANENWTRRWDGLENEILVRQSYPEGWAQQWIHDLMPMFEDDRYLRFEGKPVVAVYRAGSIPEAARATEVWRSECRRAGIGELHLCAVRFYDRVDTRDLGFDAAIEFPPHELEVKNIAPQIVDLATGFDGFVYDYREAVRQSLQNDLEIERQLIHRGVMTAWDNTPRRGRSAHLALGATPEAYGEWLAGLVRRHRQLRGREEGLIFINAWNEWAEGAILEPDSHFGRGFLEATRDALGAAERPDDPA